MAHSDVFDDLEAEQQQLETVLAGLGPDDWTTPSAAAGWTIADVLLHLAQTEEAVTATVGEHGDPVRWHELGATVDEAMGALVEAERGDGPRILDRWRAARREAVAALRSADPDQAVRWVATPLKPRTLATTRLAEHWAHALDITVPLGVDYPDTARLRHVAWLGLSTLPYAFRLAGLPPAPVRAGLTAPDGTSWQLGDPAAETVISGPAGDFCRVGAQRLAPADTTLRATGPHAATALRLLRNYAVS
ncbi:TIGR03084 family protein [Actinoplanes philippinensis]|uniref:TIGR03084 family protein n=1 Tax=Actinoplanes philippinensis TaxID=35752 RepID=A0A1I2ED17_9ACTN|nr:maleylpyruvate isomerase family mycothiol-dependent enzyme [Actinoplanes philippinensis]GIE77071.1 TIGR03084 family protein [Actinoplanes philippinensis]SFE90944.1 TIGR03084 family protein [Actinoplanes philippinensis]